jgi:hypothetical protein
MLLPVRKGRPEQHRQMQSRPPVGITDAVIES